MRKHGQAENPTVMNAGYSSVKAALLSGTADRSAQTHAANWIRDLHRHFHLDASNLHNSDTYLSLMRGAVTTVVGQRHVWEWIEQLMETAPAVTDVTTERRHLINMLEHEQANIVQMNEARAWVIDLCNHAGITMPKDVANIFAKFGITQVTQKGEQMTVGWVLRRLVDGDFKAVCKPVDDDVPAPLENALHPTVSANDRQVGGSHYAAEIQHWDFIIRNGIPYLPAQVLRYVLRARKKNGEQDYEKGLHYIDKMLEISAMPENPRPITLEEFMSAQAPTPEEQAVAALIMAFHETESKGVLEAARLLLSNMILNQKG